jgi:hypothetical protein
VLSISVLAGGIPNQTAGNVMTVDQVQDLLAEQEARFEAQA